LKLWIWSCLLCWSPVPFVNDRASVSFQLSKPSDACRSLQRLLQWQHARFDSERSTGMSVQGKHLQYIVFLPKLILCCVSQKLLGIPTKPEIKCTTHGTSWFPVSWTDLTSDISPCKKNLPWGTLIIIRIQMLDLLKI
jgi:hypothetical protein